MEENDIGGIVGKIEENNLELVSALEKVRDTQKDIKMSQEYAKAAVKK